MRVVRIRTGVVLDRTGGALAKMLLPFQLGIGGPVAGGRQFMPWIHADDVVGMFLAALGDERWEGAVNATAPVPVTNREFSRALGRALHRPALLPVPGIALQRDLWRNGPDRHDRRACRAGQAAGAVLPVPPSGAG